MKRIDRMRRPLQVLAGAAFALLAFGTSGNVALASPSEIPGSGGTGVVPVPPDQYAWSSWAAARAGRSR
jgi:hypothetical protein